MAPLAEQQRSMTSDRMDLLFVMHGPETVDPSTDTSLSLMAAAGARGHRCWHGSPADLSAIDGRVILMARQVIGTDHGLQLGAAAEIDVAAVDVVMVRTDPPFDPAYLHTTLLLDLVVGDTLVVNRPQGLRDANEKLYALRFPDLCPPTIVTADRDRLRSFAKAHDGAVVKPIDGHGGRGIFVVRAGDPNAESILDTVTVQGATPVVAQQFLPGVRDGDKRILVLDGTPLGAILRRPADDDFRANICVGGSVELAELDEVDARIVATLAPSLRADGLYFVGLDVVGGCLTEVNVTSPTGLRQLTDLSGIAYDEQVIEWLQHAVRSAG